MHIKKRLVALLMASVMMFTMIGCSDSKVSEETEKTEETEVDIEQVVVGTWVYEWELTAEDITNVYSHNEVGDTETVTLELYRGGTGNIDFYNQTRHESIDSYNLTWEAVDDDMINIEYSRNSTQFGIEYDEDEDTLSYVNGWYTFTREE